MRTPRHKRRRGAGISSCRGLPSSAYNPPVTTPEPSATETPAAEQPQQSVPMRKAKTGFFAKKYPVNLSKDVELLSQVENVFSDTNAAEYSNLKALYDDSVDLQSQLQTVVDTDVTKENVSKYSSLLPKLLSTLTGGRFSNVFSGDGIRMTPSFVDDKLKVGELKDIIRILNDLPAESGTAAKTTVLNLTSHIQTRIRTVIKNMKNFGERIVSYPGTKSAVDLKPEISNNLQRYRLASIALKLKELLEVVLSSGDKVEDAAVIASNKILDAALKTVGTEKIKIADEKGKTKGQKEKQVKPFLRELIAVAIRLGRKGNKDLIQQLNKVVVLRSGISSAFAEAIKTLKDLLKLTENDSKLFDENSQPTVLSGAIDAVLTLKKGGGQTGGDETIDPNFAREVLLAVVNDDEFAKNFADILALDTTGMYESIRTYVQAAKDDAQIQKSAAKLYSTRNIVDFGVRPEKAPEEPKPESAPLPPVTGLEPLPKDELTQEREKAVENPPSLLGPSSEVPPPPTTVSSVTSSPGSAPEPTPAPARTPADETGIELTSLKDKETTQAPGSNVDNAKTPNDVMNADLYHSLNQISEATQSQGENYNKSAVIEKIADEIRKEGNTLSYRARYTLVKSKLTPLLEKKRKNQITLEETIDMNSMLLLLKAYQKLDPTIKRGGKTPRKLGKKRTYRKARK